MKLLSFRTVGECKSPPEPEKGTICHVVGEEQVTKHLSPGAAEEHLEFHDRDYPGECRD